MRYHFRLEKYDADLEEFYGTILTLGNGYIGVRGDIELEPSSYGTIIAGLYDHAPYFYREIVNAPRVVGISISLNGEPLSLNTCKLHKYERELDIDNGVLKTWIDMGLQQGGDVSYESIRFVHGVRKGLVVLRFKIKPGTSGNLVVRAPIELDTLNPSYCKEIMVKHYTVEKCKDFGDLIYAEAETNDNKYVVGIASSLRTNVPHSRFVVNNGRGIEEILSMDVAGGKEYEFTRYVVISHRKNHEKGDIEHHILRNLREVKSVGFDTIYDEHREYWKRLWSRARVKIKGDENAEKSLLFSLFHLMQCMPSGSGTSLTARGLHGFGYRGHIFWDTEIYALPFFIAVFPEKARGMLIYRYNGLPAARLNAKSNGYAGAQFPWESADDGAEATPSRIPLDLEGRSFVRIYTGEEEHHITADIAYSIDMYYRFTGDRDFLTKYGLEIIFETARFWASRVSYDKDRGYVIKRVIGPDEYHEHVDNNFFTNLMAKHNLTLAIRYFELSKHISDWNQVAEEVGIEEDEVALWKKIAENMYIPVQEDGVWEEFDGYFNLRDYTVDPFEVGEDRLPGEIRGDIHRTKLVKQADVVALQYLLREHFDLDDIKRNFEYYLVRTTHASSLSMPAYAIVASWIGRMDIAYDYFMKCTRVDLDDIYGNTKEGFHLATAGGAWQILFRGFCGITVDGDVLEVSPNLPPTWQEVNLRFYFRGSLVNLNVRNDQVCVEVIRGDEVALRAFGKEVTVRAGKKVRVNKS